MRCITPQQKIPIAMQATVDLIKVRRSLVPPKRPIFRRNKIKSVVAFTQAAIDVAKARPATPTRPFRKGAQSGFTLFDGLRLVRCQRQVRRAGFAVPDEPPVAGVQSRRAQRRSAVDEASSHPEGHVRG